MIKMGSKDFPRYLLVLGEISRNMDTCHGFTVAEQFLDICVRVPQAPAKETS